MTEGFSDAIEELLPAYALNALDERERDVVERALEREPRYQTLLSGYLGAAVSLAPVAPITTAPATVHERVMRSVWSPPPAAIGMATRVRARVSIAMLGVAAAWVFAFVAVGTVEMVHARRVHDLEQQVNNLASQNQLQAQRLQQQAELATLSVQQGVQQASMESVTTAAPPQDAPAGLIYTKADGSQVLFAMNLAPTQNGDVYKVWLNEGTGETYAMATFTVGQDGLAFVPMHMSSQYQGPLWITVLLEQDSNSDMPVGSPVLWGRLR